MNWFQKPKVDGLIKFYHLENWWFTAFTEEERYYMESKFKGPGISHSLTKGIISTSMPVTDFLSSFKSWFSTPTDSKLAKIIQIKIEELAESNPIKKPGYFKGRHFTTYVSDVGLLEQQGKTAEAINLLLNLVIATETASKADNLGVAPWYYERLAIIYRKQKAYDKEVEILERYAKQKHAPGVGPAKLSERLEKAKKLLENSSIDGKK